jgi:hypothetical protein
MAPEGFLWYLILGTFTKICIETPDLVKMGQKYWAIYMETWLIYSVDSSMTYCLARLLWYWCICCTYRSKDSSLLGCLTLSLGECFLALWGHSDHSKRWEILTQCHCMPFKKAWIFSNTAVRTKHLGECRSVVEKLSDGTSEVNTGNKSYSSVLLSSGPVFEPAYMKI